ncbi:hypothetical protein EG68_08393 [Paragonimus skrjabini miyazakii]|uniref:RRM domain-containing protein n=1 Tax=Paragonimus skrjabini miyazakii TaxID=59628 RepID=A0A8S9YPB5_9TREM|nr:hypothetical protein EG68_08393 [Paragonimus skrjabini miyazakii]
MESSPLIIEGFTAIHVLLAGRVHHYLYAKRSKDDGIWVANIHPFLDENTLSTFFSQFGTVIGVEFHVLQAGALIRFEDAKTCDKVLTIPMKKKYPMDIAKLELPDPIRTQKLEWISDYQAAKKESEAALEAYFKHHSDKRTQADEDGWIVVNKKRRFQSH